MDYFTKNRMLFWCVLVLIVLNAVTLTSFWLSRQPPLPNHGRQSGPNGQDVMKEHLRLSEEQILQLEQIREQHFSRAEPLLEDMHRVRLDILDELFAPQPDKNKIQQMLDELNLNQGQFNDELFGHFQEMIAICDPQQAEELRFMLVELIEKTRYRLPQDPRRGPKGRQGPMRDHRLDNNRHNELMENY